MDSEKRTPGNEHNPAQNELDLGFSQIEPITPKKLIKPAPSLFEKAKGLFAKKEQKNMENQFATRKEPLFGSAGASGDSSMTTENTNEKFSTENQEPPFSQNAATVAPIETTAEANIATAVENEVKAAVETVTEKVETNVENAVETFSDTIADLDGNVESVQTELTESQEKPKAGFKNPENWAILSILPQKHRRIFVALSAVVLLLIFILWMKPSSDTVQSYEQQSNNGVPIQFQQLDQSQPVEPTVLDNPAPQNDNATAQQESAPTQPEATAANAEQKTTEQATATSVAEQTAMTATENKPAEVSVETKPAESKSTETVKSTEPAKPQETKPQEIKAHQSHRENVKKADAAKTEKAKVTDKAVAKNQQTKTQSAKTEQQVIDILEAKPSATKATAGSKTLTIPQGVTLMQVFRDNRLPVADVNAMTKANGVGNALSSFKPGDKVQVSLNAQGRVSELRLANGARFTRQSDGSYKFKK